MSNDPRRTTRARAEVCGFAVRLTLGGASEPPYSVTDPIVDTADLMAALAAAGVTVEEIVGGPTGSCSIAGDYVVLVQEAPQRLQQRAEEVACVVKRVYDGLAARQP